MDGDNLVQTAEGRNDASKSAQAEGSKQRLENIQMTGGSLTVVARDMHQHTHYHETPAEVLSVLKRIPNFRNIHIATLSKATPGTCEWFLVYEKFCIWLDFGRLLKIVWGYGSPGAGKTILLSMAVRAAEAVAEASALPVCVAYIYIRYSNQTETTVRDFLEVLVKQTVERHPRCLPAFNEAYARHIHEDTHPSEDELLDLLRRFVDMMVATFYFLDALDEAPAGIQLDLIEKLTSLKAKLFITSRPLKALEAHFPHAHCFPIAAHDRDLELHVTREISRSVDLCAILGEGNTAARKEIISSIKEKCNGMFLHASLQLDALKECTTIQDIQETLEKFPPKIEDVYVQTWNRILSLPQKKSILARRVILCVLCAAGPLSLETVRHLIATCPETYSFGSSRLVPAATLLTYCQGLVIVEEEAQQVRLVHYTAKDTLQRLVQETFPQPHSLLSAVCTTRLSDCGFQCTENSPSQTLEAALKGDPLLAYAYGAWPFHARKSLEEGPATSRIIKFVQGCRAFPLGLDTPSYGKTHGPIPSLPGIWPVVVGIEASPSPRSRHEVLGPLHVACYFDLPISMAGSEILQNLNIPSPRNKSTPLCLACSQNSVSRMEELLSLPDISLNEADKMGRTPLMLATWRGGIEAVQLLLAHSQTDVNIEDERGRTALTCALLKRRRTIFRLLLGHPNIDVNLKDRRGRTPLMRLALRRRKGDVKLLLAHPQTDATTADSKGRTALIFAALGGCHIIFELLLALPDADVNQADLRGWTVLTYALAQRNTVIVSLLLSHPKIDINLLITRGWVVLFELKAIALQPLITHPKIEVNQMDRDGWTALSLASRDGEEDLVNLILSNPCIEVNAMDGRGCTALGWALREGCLRVAWKLMAHLSIDINGAAMRGYTALTLTCSSGTQGALELLLGDSRVKVNSEDDEGYTPLIRASQNGRRNTVIRLLNHPHITVNLADKNGCTPLIWATRNGHNDVVRLLLTVSELDVNLADEEGWSALFWAPGPATLSLLLSHPEIDVNLKDKEGCTALELASKYGEQALVELFLAHPLIEVPSRLL